MAPPKFDDIGKAASDLFGDDFGGDAHKLTLKSKASNGTNIKVEGARSNANGAVAALLETKFKHQASGLTVKEKWTTKNVVTTEVTADNKLVKGLSSTFCANFSPNGGGISGLKVKNSFTHGNIASNLDVTTKDVNASGVFAFNKWLFGAGSTCSLANFGLQNTKVTVGYTEGDLKVTSSITDAGAVTASLFHTPTPDVDAGVELGWNKASSATTFAVAGKYVLDSQSFAKAKIDSSLNVSLSYVQTLREGVTLRLSADVNGAKLSQDAHTLGMHLTLEN